MNPAFISATLRGSGEPVIEGSQAPVPWWSFSKTALAACTLLLAAEGRLALDDSLKGRPYTLRQLLQHRAGVPEYGRMAAYHEAVAGGDAPWTVEELLRRVDADRLDFEPGTGWAYSNVGYLLVRRTLEETFGKDIGSVLQRLLFEPLGLASVRLASTPDDLAGTAWGNADGYHPGWVYHGLLVGSAGDALRFLHLLMSGDVLGPDLLAAMTDCHPLDVAPQPGRPWLTAGYGLGLMTGTVEQAGAALGHSGNGPGSVCAVYHYPDLGPARTVAVFAQADNEGVTETEAARLACRQELTGRTP